MKTARIGTMPHPNEIQLEECSNVVSFLQTIDRIAQALKDPNNVAIVIHSGLRIKQKSKFTHKVHTIIRRGSDAEQLDQVQQKIIQFIQKNEQLYPHIDFEKSIRPLYDLPIFKCHSQRLDVIKENIQEILETVELLRVLRQEPRDATEIKNIRYDNSRMDVHFLSSDQKQVSAHQVFLSRKFPTDLSDVADAETIELFIDIEYKVENLDKFPDDSFYKLLILSQHLNHLKLTLKIVELFIYRLNRSNPPLIAALPFILNIPPYLFCPKLFEAILRAFRQDKDSLISFTENLLTFQSEKPANAILTFLIGYLLYKEGNPQDRNKIFILFDRAANLGLPLAIYFLGKCYRDGIGVEESASSAVILFKRAAELEIPKAWVSLGHMYVKPECRVFPNEERNRKVVEECYEESYRLESIDVATTLDRCLKFASLL